MKPLRLKTLLTALCSGAFLILLAVLVIPVELPFLFTAPPAPAVSFHSELPPPKATAGPARHVIIISIDGLRADAIDVAQAPTLLSLMSRGARADDAETIRPSITLPSHTAMLTGLGFARHGVVWNNYRPGHIVHPTVFSIAAGSGLSTAMLFAKDKFHYLANPGQAHWIYGPAVPNVTPRVEDVTRPDFQEYTGPDATPAAPAVTAPQLPRAEPKGSASADGLARAFAEEWPRVKYQLTFIHFGEPDAAGHGRGWMTRPYLDAVLEVDAAIGSILKTLKDCGVAESTAVIVSADHGGEGRGHYSRSQPDRPENVTIPWICAGPGVPQGLRIRRPIRTMDTTPTALRFLGLPAPAGIDGAAVREVFAGN